jgi:hypothetical protein
MSAAQRRAKAWWKATHLLEHEGFASSDLLADAIVAMPEDHELPPELAAP